MCSPSNNVSITTLLSIGLHPLSYRQRRAEQDAKALEIMLSFAPEHTKALHVGDSEDPKTLEIMHDYLGMGLYEVDLLHAAQNEDAALGLLNFLTKTVVPLPDIMLAGTRSEREESSGFLPYYIAENLKIPLVPNICELLSISKEKGVAEVMQSLPRGQRRRIKVNLPFIATVGSAAPSPRQSSFKAAKQGKISLYKLSECRKDACRESWHIENARPRPKRLKIVKAKTAAQRFKAATAKAQSSKGETIYDIDEAVTAILKILRQEKVLHLSKK